MPQRGPIKDWTTSQLKQFVSEVMRTSPSELGSVTAAELKVQRLTVEESVDHPEDSLHLFGGNGEPAFAHSWVAGGGSFRAPGFWKDNTGVVRLQGWVKNGTIGQTIADPLPPGYRPQGLVSVSVLTSGATGQVDIAVDGTIKVQSPAGPISVSLDNIYFRTD